MDGIDLLVLTALTEEAQVVKALLDEVCVQEGADGHIRVYRYAGLSDLTFRIAAASAHHMGAVGMGVFAAPLLNGVKPKAAALVGIAAAVDTKEADLGDVPFASQVLSYDDIAVQDGVLTFRSEGYQTDPSMRAAIGEVRTSLDLYGPWREECLTTIPAVVGVLNQLRRTKIKPPDAVEAPHLVVGATAGGPFLLRDQDFRDSLTKRPELPKPTRIAVSSPLHPKLVSAEMEAHGFMRAALEAGVPASVLKGISDVGDAEKAELEKKTGGFFRAFACANALLAVLHALKARDGVGAVVPDEPPPPTTSSHEQLTVDSDADEESKPESEPVPWVGWESVAPTAWASMTPPTARRVERYANGGAPTWALAREGVLPARSAVAKLSGDFVDACEDNQSLLTVVLGPGGEGKSTVAMQIAALLSEREGWDLLRSYVGAPVEERWVHSLAERDGPTLLLVENADLMLEQIRSIDQATALLPRGKVHMLCTAREQDWYRATAIWKKQHGAEPGQGGGLSAQEGRLAPVEMATVAGIVDLWRSNEIDFGKLDADRDTMELARELLRHAKGRRGLSLFGALLTARMTPPMLLDHARQIFQGLVRHGDDGPALARAFAYISFAEAAGFGGLRAEVLADLLGMSDREVWARLLNQLGAEAGVGESGVGVLTRHESIALAAAKIGMGREGAALCGIDDPAFALKDIVRQTILTEKRVRIGPSFSSTVHCGRKLGRRLSRVLRGRIEPAEAHRIAVTAALAAVEYRNRADAVVDYCQALDAAERFDEAIAAFREHWPKLDTTEDFNESARGYLFAWAVSEGRRSALSNLWLALLSISDEFPDAPIRSDKQPPEPLFQAKTSVSGVGRALQRLRSIGRAKWRATGLVAAATLGALTDPDSTTRGFFQSHLRTARQLGGPRSLSPSKALATLSRLSEEAHSRLDDPLLEALAPPTLTFGALAALLEIPVD